MTMNRRMASQWTIGVAAALALQTAQPLHATDRRKIRVGQIGTKHAHAGGKMECVRKLSNEFEVVGVVESDETARAAATKDRIYSGLKWMTRRELLEQSDLSLVLVETDIDDLLPTAKACLAAGAHIHLDKPAGTKLTEFEAVVQLARDHQRLIQLGYMFRSNPAFRFLFDATKRGWLGEIFEVHGVMSKKLDKASRADVARYRGGSMFELGCHLIDAVVRLLGEPQRVTAFNRQVDPSDEMFDNCLAVFSYPKATATIRSSMVEVDGGKRRQFTVCGTRGTIEVLPLEPPQLKLTLEQPQGEYRRGTQVVELPAMQGRYDDELMHLASAIRGEVPFAYSLEHDLLTQKCILLASDML